MSDSQQFLRELDKKLWTVADKLRASLDAVVYKHAVFGLIFLKYVSNSLAARQREIEVSALTRWKILLDSAKLSQGTEIEIRNGKKSFCKITSTSRLIDDASRCHRAGEQPRTLASMRDTLMPRLLNGELQPPISLIA